MSGLSSNDSLRRLSPASDLQATAVFGAAGREQLLDGLTSLPVGRGARARTAPPRRRRLVVAAAVATLVLTATAATWTVLSGGPARETTSIECSVGGTDTIIPATSGDPAADCAAQLQRDEGKAPPPLVAYDNTVGGVTVLPRSVKAPAGYKRLASGQDVDLIQLQNSLDDYVSGLNSRCLSGHAATDLAKAKLAQFGFTGWSVTVRGESYASNCVAGDYVDPVKQRVELIPLEIPASPKATYQKLADKLRPLTQKCQSLPSAVASVRAVAGGLGLSESAKAYELNAVTDNSLRCASIYETVGGAIFLTVRGPNR
jgi:hypothetical protein